MGEQRDDTWNQKIPWRRGEFSWEAKLVDKLMQLVDEKNPSRDCQDRRVQRDDVKGLFVKSLYFILHNTEQGENNNIFKALWKLNSIPRAIHLG